MLDQNQVQHLTTKDLAFRLKVHPVTIAQWRVYGIGPKFIKTGKYVFYPLSEIEKWEHNKIRFSTCDSGSHDNDL